MCLSNPLKKTVFRAIIKQNSVTNVAHAWHSYPGNFVSVIPCIGLDFFFINENAAAQARGRYSVLLKLAYQYVNFDKQPNYWAELRAEIQK